MATQPRLSGEQSHASQPSPEHFFSAINSYQTTAALKGAIELDLFTAIGEGNSTPESIAVRLQASARGVRILSDYLTISGFLNKADGHYSLTPDSAMFLDRRSPAYLGSAIGFLAHPTTVHRYDYVVDAVRKGGTASPEGANIEPDNPIWAEFARSMAPLMIPAAEFIARALDADAGTPWKVLDIAAGHGTYGITLARHNRNARVVAVDGENVLAVAKDNAAKFGVSDRWSALPGSAFDVDFGDGYDVALVTGFLHHFDADTNIKLLRKVREALKPGGRVAITEFVPNDDRVTPPTVAAFSLTMLVATDAGDAHTWRELQSMIRNAGYAESELHTIPNYVQQVIIARK